MTSNGTPSAPDAVEDRELLDRLRRMWEHRDPVPPELADLVCFALELESGGVEFLRSLEHQSVLSGARNEERTRTVTFYGESLSAMITIEQEAADRLRVDGWIAEGRGLRVGLRSTGQERETAADEDGRFVFDTVPPGFVQLVFHPTEGAGIRLVRAVVTPTMTF